jgi:DNA-binding transcriptional MerR regulator|tara:strand:+ start:4017 stop:4715 length:699 start_codon:yes stop_codon:yes gene_type:complete
MGIFGKKKEKGAPAAPGGEPSSPVNQVLSMRQQGVPNDKIIDALKSSGFSSSQIFDAMSQADTMGAAGPITPPPPGGPGEAPPQPGMAPPPGAGDVPQFPQPAAEPHPIPPMPAQAQPAESVDRETIEEVAESIIDEKWEEISKNINKIVEWKSATETKIIKLDQQFKDLKAEFENLHKALISKVNEYDQNILNVGTEIKAMEKVFQKVLPTFTENVSELSRLTGKMKKTKK